MVCYEFDAYQIGDDKWKFTKLGSRVQIVDDDMDLDTIERISYVKRNLKGRDSLRISIGKRVNPLVEKFKAEEKTSKKTTGNSTRSRAASTVTTRNTYSSGSALGTLGGDGWVHQIDGVTQQVGTINFVTTPANTTGGGS